MISGEHFVDAIGTGATDGFWRECGSVRCEKTPHNHRQPVIKTNEKDAKKKRDFDSFLFLQVLDGAGSDSGGWIQLSGRHLGTGHHRQANFIQPFLVFALNKPKFAVIEMAEMTPPRCSMHPMKGDQFFADYFWFLFDFSCVSVAEDSDASTADAGKSSRVFTGNVEFHRKLSEEESNAEVGETLLEFGFVFDVFVALCVGVWFC